MSVLGEAQSDSDNGPAHTTSGGRGHHDSSATIAFNDKVCHEGEEKVVH